MQRDDRRRATHNEVERRRRDKINNWIMKLSKIVPECQSDNSKGYDVQVSRSQFLHWMIFLGFIYSFLSIYSKVKVVFLQKLAITFWN